MKDHVQISHTTSELDRLVKGTVYDRSESNLKHPKTTKRKEFSYKPVNVDELEEAEREIIKKVQYKAFGDEITLLRHLHEYNTRNHRCWRSW